MLFGSFNFSDPLLPLLRWSVVCSWGFSHILSLFLSQFTFKLSWLESLNLISTFNSGSSCVFLRVTTFNKITAPHSLKNVMFDPILQIGLGSWNLGYRFNNRSYRGLIRTFTPRLSSTVAHLEVLQVHTTVANIFVRQWAGFLVATLPVWKTE